MDTKNNPTATAVAIVVIIAVLLLGGIGFAFQGNVHF